MKKLFKVTKTTTYEIHGKAGDVGDIVYAEIDGTFEWVKKINETVERQDYSFDPETLKFRFEEPYKISSGFTGEDYEKWLKECNEKTTKG